MMQSKGFKWCNFIYQVFQNIGFILTSSISNVRYRKDTYTCDVRILWIPVPR